jgi:hypothetical protein
MKASFFARATMLRKAIIFLGGIAPVAVELGKEALPTLSH